MATERSNWDQFQKEDTGDRRNAELAKLLGSAWKSYNIKSIKREPDLTCPPSAGDSDQGRWIAERCD